MYDILNSLIWNYLPLFLILDLKNRNVYSRLWFRVQVMWRILFNHKEAVRNYLWGTEINKAQVSRVSLNVMCNVTHIADVVWNTVTNLCSLVRGCHRHTSVLASTPRFFAGGCFSLSSQMASVLRLAHTRTSICWQQGSLSVVTHLSLKDGAEVSIYLFNQ
jgi:hypothetical protein